MDFKAILDEPDRDALILSVINKELNEVLYERPTAWFAYLEERLKLGCPTTDEIARIAEAKASRDMLVHNRGVAGKNYAAKAGALARYSIGQQIDLPEPYHRAVWELLCKVVGDLATAALVQAA